MTPKKISPSDPVRSMTGYGEAEVEREGRILAAEMRTVNHRYLEMAIRLPRGCNALESRLRSFLGERLHRGKLNLTVSWKEGGDDAQLAFDEEFAARYYEMLQRMRVRFDFQEPVTLSHILANPEVLSYREPELDPEDAWNLLKTTVGRAMDALVVMREREGVSLVRDLQSRLEALRRGVAVVEARSPHRAEEAKEKLRLRVGELLAGEAEVDPERLVLEAAFAAERMDCTEECVRLVSHIDQFSEMLEQGGAVGRKLNFLLQEMNREANTIGAKANDVAVAREVIQIKEDVEILREQIQNLE